MGGIVGRLFNEFAVTIASAILISGFVSLTLTPMLSSRWLKAGHTESNNRFLEWVERKWQSLSMMYELTLKIALVHPRYVLSTLVLAVVVTAVLFVLVPKGFMPTEDTGMIQGSTQALQSISFDSMSKHQKAVAAIVQENKNVRGVMSSVGGNNTSNAGRLIIALKPFSERSEKAEKVIHELRPKVSQVPGINTFLQVPPIIRIGGQATKSLYQVTLVSSDTKHLYSSAEALTKKLESLPGFTDVTTDIMNATPQIDIKVDRDLAATLGITQDHVEQSLASAYGQRQISTIYAPSNQYRVVVELQPKFQRDPAHLSKLYVRSSTGAMVPLSAVAQLTSGVGPLVVNHLRQFPSATISFNLRPGHSIGSAVDQVNAIARNVVAPDVNVNFQGQAQAFQDSFQNMGWLLLLATIIIYTILGMLYESFVHPLTILSGLPAAGLGALGMLLVFQVDLDIYGFLGLVLLIGIVKKNAIMMIDFALDAERNSGLSAADAIYQACLVRFRPIMMTTMAALMGTLPIAIGFGAGADSRRPLGLAVVGGLLVSQLLTLYITPVVYIYMDSLVKKWRNRHGVPLVVASNAGDGLVPMATRASLCDAELPYLPGPGCDDVPDEGDKALDGLS